MEENHDINSSAKKHIAGNIFKLLSKIILWVGGIWLSILIILQIALSSSLLTDIVYKYAKDYIDGDIAFGKISVSMFRHFPNVGLTLEDFSITYPSDRYDDSERAGVTGELLWEGCGEQADTLARFSKFTVGLNIPSLITGSVNIPYLDLIQPRIFLHNYADGRSNMETIILENSESEEESSGIPALKIGTISLNSHPHVVFTDSRDSIFTVIDFKRLDFNGNIDTREFSKSHVEFSLDSMFIAGRVAADTVALGMDRINIEEHHDHIDLSAEAKTFVGTKALGRIMIPVKLEAGVSFPQDTIPALAMNHFDLSVASLPLHGSLDLRFHKGMTGVKGEIKIEQCKLDALLKELVSYVVPEAEKISTDAVLTVNGKCDGYYIHSTGKLPEFQVSLSVPDAQIKHADFPKSLRFEVEASAASDEKGRVNAYADKIGINTTGLTIQANGKALNVLSDDPLLKINSNLTAVIDSIANVFIPDSTGISAQGTLEAGINGSARVSQLDIYNFGKADLNGFAKCKRLKFKSPKDSLNVFIDKLGMKLGPETKTYGKGKKIKVLGLSGDIDSLFVTYGSSFEVVGKNVHATVKNATSFRKDTSDITPLGFRVNADMLKIKDAEATTITLDKTENGFLIYPKQGHKNIPVLTLRSQNKRIFLKNATNRVILTDASIKTDAAMNSVERKERVKKLIDSLSTVYPDIPRDSLLFHMAAVHRSKPLPNWLKEDDFKKQDPDLRLDQTFAKYFREWDLKGNINVRTGILMTPYFPLRNILRGLDVNFTNDKITIDTLAVMSGRSKLAATGSLTGIRRALLSGRSPLTLNLDVTSDKMNTDELMKAYALGSKFVAPDAKVLEEASDSEFLKIVTENSAPEQESNSLIVIPSNIIANISVNAKNIKYSDLAIKTLTSKMTMKERCVQITNTKAESNAGNISFDGFYSTQRKNDIKAGFNFNFSDITAEKVVSLMPVVDTIMPMLTSFSGLLDCDLAATAKLDTNMNIVMPTINGVLRIGGKNLTINDNAMFQDLAKKLKFNNSKTGHIDNMKVEGVIKDNKLEVFPFVLNIDRYTLAMSGIQNLDMSFKYHVSVVKSPILFRLGVDLYGDNFDKLKFRLGKPKYKNANVPVFTSVIEDTKINLLKSIRGIFEKGVEAVVNENEQQAAIEKMKKDLGYVNAAEQMMVPLTEQEQNILEGKDPVSSTIETNGGLAIKKTETIEKK